MEPLEELTSVQQAIERAVTQDPGKRGIEHLFLPGDLARAARSLRSSERCEIITGFVTADGEVETDGPAGAIELASGLLSLGIETCIITDSRCAETIQKADASVPVADFGVTACSAQHRVSIERLGRARDGRYYTMAGRDVTHLNEPLDDLFLPPHSDGVITIGVGDGGNEIGMGRVASAVARFIPAGERIASCVITDFLIAAGCSNWGAWGLLAELTLLTGQKLLPTLEQAWEDVELLVHAGAVDGRTGQRKASVDGLTKNEYLAPLAVLHSLVEE